MEDHQDVHHDDLLQRAVDAVMHGSPPDALPPDQVAQLATVVRQAADQPYPITLISRIKDMRLTTRVAVAAAALIACVALLSWLELGTGASVAFADVAEALSSVRSATWETTAVLTVRLPGEKEEKTITRNQNHLFLAPSHERMEMATDGQNAVIGIVDGEKNKAISLIPAIKTAAVINTKNFPAEDGFFGKTFQRLRELAANAQSGKAGEVERLGTKTIEDRPAEGFRFQQGSLKVEIWADPKTSLPIRVEYTSTELKSSTVMTDFRINVPLDESLFSVEVPAGYTVDQTTEIDASKPWTVLVGALKMAAESNDGVFPPSLRGEQGVVSFIQRKAQTLSEKHKGSSEESLKQGRDIAMNLAAVIAFLVAAPPDAVHYAGKDVKLGTPNRPILWFKQPRKGDRCLVIYADLSVQEVAPEAAPKLPESEGSPKP